MFSLCKAGRHLLIPAKRMLGVRASYNVSKKWLSLLIFSHAKDDESKKLSNCAPVNFAMVELLPVPVDPTQIMQVPALSSSSGGTTGGRSTRAEKSRKPVVSCVNFGTLRGIVVLFWGHHWRQVNSCWKSRKPAVSCVNFKTLRGIVVLFRRHHWRQINSC